MADLSTIRSDLFKDVKFFLADESNEKVKQLLKQGGASREFFVSNLVTHIVSSSVDFPEYNQAKDIGIPIVKPEWVTLSVNCDALLPGQQANTSVIRMLIAKPIQLPEAVELLAHEKMQRRTLQYKMPYIALRDNAPQPDITVPFSPEKNKLFSGVVACPSQIPAEDRDALWAMVTFYGGRCQTALDASCTHLLVPKPQGDKYECALQHADKVKIVVPEWIVDCIKAKALLDESNYAPVSDDDSGVKSESILTPDNTGQTTGATVKANTENVSATPSSLLSPESPSITKLKKESEAKNSEEKEKQSKESSENKEPSEDEENHEDSTGESGKKKGRQAAQTAKERLKAVAKLCSGPEKNEENDRDYVNQEEGQSVKDKQEKAKQVIEIQDESDPYERKVVVVSNLLSGCIFYISDYPLYIEPTLLNTWITVIKQHGAEVVPSYSSSCTHFLCIHQHGKHYRQALNEGKYMVSAYWLNDVLSSKKLFAPRMSLHLPVPFREKVARCRNMIISVTGFEGEERRALKHMIHMVGAKYTGYLSRSNTHLICHSETGEKYKKAKEWGINCANARWLGDIMTGGCDYPVNMKRYQAYGDESEFDINAILTRELLEPWKDFQEREETTDKKRKLEMLESEINEHETKKARIDDSTPQSGAVDRVTGPPRVVFTGLNPTAVRRLTEQLKALGGEPADSVKSCTHIVASKIMRTIKFLTGISVCRYIVSPEWIEASYAANYYLDENEYILRDLESEKLYGMCLPESIKMAQARPLFKDMMIYVTPNVRPDQKSMNEIVGGAGGKLLDQMPTSSSFKDLAEKKTDQDKPAFVCVTCDEDLHLCKEMKHSGIGVHNVEFVLSGILKQTLDFFRYKL